MRIAGTLLLLSLAASANAAIPDAERQALIALYDATAGDSWTNKSGWKGAAGTECTWFGVTCDGSSVLSIVLPSNNLTGTFPALALPNMTDLNLEKNHLSGPLPEFAVGLQLNTLELASNALTGEIPRSILNLTRLGSLDIVFNGLSSHDPQVQQFVTDRGGPVLKFQTVAPSGVLARPDNRSAITVSWTPLPFPTITTHYDIYSGTTLVRTVSYASNVATFTGLDSSKSYDFRIRTVADPHTNNTNRIESGFSPTIQAEPGPAPRTFDIGAPNLKTYWVDPVSGNDSNNGSSPQVAFKTVNAAYDAARLKGTGYELVLRPGDYPAENFNAQMYGSASQEAPIIIRAEVTDTARLHGNLAVAGSHVYVIGVRIDIAFAFGTPGTDYLLLRDVHTIGNININGGTHVYLENVHAEGTGGGGAAITLSGVQYGHITGSRVSSTTGGCILITAGSAYLTVDSNDIGPCSFGVQLGQSSDLIRLPSPWMHYDAYDVKVMNNTIHDPGVAISAAGAYNVLFAQNTVVSRSGQFIYASLGSRSCGDPTACQTRHDAGGWGPTTPGASVYLPNKNVLIAGNIFYSPVANPQMIFVGAFKADTTGSPAATNIPSPVRSDDNLQVRGNLVWAPQIQPLGSQGGCDNSNPTCNAAQIQTDNRINSIEPQFVDATNGNYHPRTNGNLFGLPAITFAPFTWTDAPTPPPVPAGELVNTVAIDADGRARNAYVPGAFVQSTEPIRQRVVKH